MAASDIFVAVPEALSVRQFQQVYGIGHSKVYALIKSGELRAVKVGDRTLIRKVDADAWLASLQPMRLAS
jgi:excisionase family DNA binding protein